MWISVDERLPQNGGHYLVYWDKSSSRDYPAICCKEDVILYSGGKWWAPVNNENPITHWMPLPPQPE